MAHGISIAVLLALVSLVGCADPSAAAPPGSPPAPEASSAPIVRPGVSRSNVATPFVTLSPSEVAVVPGAKVTLTAKPGGGEAMRFTVDWQVQEEAAGGSVERVTAPQADGTFAATYTAPMDGQGPYHVTARLHEYPQATAVTTITVVRTGKKDGQ
ncbi:hypothetical protein [Piscinibacter terrae]|uniref:Ig-like domain-containing protein n=1 Tax=Piscinibacter terrae TaxID=2496871 RepID=A0A3N7HKL3_9BURK|nr:hypothetical protein [Albitalea terrae]RQP22638.1 hypothetical protein DZC73_20230 [Albitalea terrae]